MNDVSTVIGWGGIVLAVGGVVMYGVGKGMGRRMFGGIAALGAILAVIGFLVVPLFSTTSTGPSNAPPTASISVVSATAPALPAGCTLLSSSYTINCHTVYNSTSNYFAIQNALGTGTASGAYYIQVPFKMIRTDAINATYSFASSVASIPTANSLGASPSTYSIVGFSAATSTTPGTWQIYPSAGTLASQTPTVNAPGTSTNVISTGVPVTSFGSVTNTWHITLAGKNSTSAPTLFAEALQNYTSYPVTFDFANAGASATWTLNFVLIGWDK